MILQVGGVLATVLLSAFLFMMAGMKLHRLAIDGVDSHPLPLQFGLGYFFGMAMFLSLWRVSACLLGNAKIALALSAILLLLFVLWRFRTVFRSAGERPEKPGIVGTGLAACLSLPLFAAFFVYILLYWIQPFSELLPTSMIGSLHSGRYANIATYIFEKNSIPVLNQNYGQSILSSIPLFFGLNSPYLALNFWLSTSLVFLFFTVYGLFRWFGLSEGRLLAGTFMLMFGNTALSLTHVLVIDSGSPFVFNGYTDSIFSIGSFLGFLLLLQRYYHDDIKSIFYASFMISILCVSWNIASSQNVVLSLALLIPVLIIIWLQKRFSWKQVFLGGLVVVMSVAGSTMGGMLSPKSLQDNVDIPGVMKVEKTGYTGINPAFPYWRGIAGNWQISISDHAVSRRELLADARTNKSMDALHELYYRAETDLFSVMRVSFFPILGTVMLWRIVRRMKADGPHALKDLWFVSSFSLLCGIAISFSIMLNGYKWELSRFLIPGYLLGLVSFVVALDSMLDGTTKAKARMIVAAALVAMTFGPVFNSGMILHRNVYFSKGNVVPFNERLKMIVGLHGIQGR